MNRRAFLSAGSCAALSLNSKSALAAKPFRVHNWKRDPLNPILPVGGGAFDVKRCMNPFVVTKDGEYWLFYGGSDKNGRHTICLATCPVDDVSSWKRLGPILEPGGKGAFDELWTVLPCLHRFGDQWHLYYTGRSADRTGLQSFRGIGLATSTDLLNWKKVSDEPVLLGDGFDQWPGNKGIAGGGPIIEIPQEDGRTLYRINYTLATGSPSKDLRVDQAKQSVIAHSYDGLTWCDRRVILQPREEASYENAATIALNPWQTDDGKWRAMYAGIGTRFGAYSICEAASDDGDNWYRGAPGENLSLPPGKAAWENRMTEYPHIVKEGDHLRLFYCGNGYGSTGIGTAVAEKLS